MTDYYDGDLSAIDDVAVRQFGSPWRLAGWCRLREIPPGAPLSYAGLAEALGAPSAVRAAAGICASNAPALFVPCHRVLGKGGLLTGYAGGLWRKKWLLEHEGVLPKELFT